MTVVTQELQQHWMAISSLLSLRSEADYDQALMLLDQLLEQIETDEQHPLYSLLDTLGTLVHAYEEEHLSIPQCSGVELLLLLMEEHGLGPADLPEIGSQAVVSDVLRGKRELSVRQIRALASRFHVSPALFMAG